MAAKDAGTQSTLDEMSYGAKNAEIEKVLCIYSLKSLYIFFLIFLALKF